MLVDILHSQKPEGCCDGPFMCAVFWEAKVFSQKSLLSSSSRCISSNSAMKPQPHKVSKSFIGDVAWRHGIDRN